MLRVFVADDLTYCEFSNEDESIDIGTAHFKSLTYEELKNIVKFFQQELDKRSKPKEKWLSKPFSIDETDAWCFTNDNQ